MKLEYYWQILNKQTNAKFSENPSSGSRVVPCGQTDGHENNSSFFCKFAKSPKKISYCIGECGWTNRNNGD